MNTPQVIALNKIRKHMETMRFEPQFPNVETVVIFPRNLKGNIFCSGTSVLFLRLPYGVNKIEDRFKMFNLQVCFL